MDRLKKEYKAWQYIILGFLIPFLILVVTFMGLGITPFGPYSLLVSDLRAAHIDSLTLLRRIMLGESSLAYSWGQIQGSAPFASLGVGILISSFNFLVCLFPEDQILTALTWIVVLRLSLCGATFAFYLKKRFKRNDLSISIFAWCYALMSFAVIYYFHIIWLDQLMMLPLVLWGVERIIKNKKDYLFFTITLTIVFFMNFYMAYMLGLFAFLYFLYQYVIQNSTYDIKEFGRKLLQFLVSPIIAFGCSAILLVPILLLLSNRDGIFAPSQMAVSLRYEFSALLSKLCIGSLDTILPDGIPFIYCGYAIVIFILFYFLSYSISYKEKLCTFILGLFMFLSLTINPLYVAWHGFKPPVYFEGRFSFIVCFFMIYVGYKGLMVIHTISIKQVHQVFGILGVMLILLNRQVYSFVSDEALIYTLVFLLLYYALMILTKKKTYYKRYFFILLALLVGCELSVNAMKILLKLSEPNFELASSYYADYKVLQSEVSAIQEMDPSFYRIEKEKERSMNDGFGVGYPSISHFDSLYNYEIKETIGGLGMQTGHNWIRYKGATPITDMLFNIKYVVMSDEAYQGYEIIKEQQPANIFKNPYAVSLGFMMAQPMNQAWEERNPIHRQELCLEDMLGNKQTYFTETVLDEPVLENLGVQIKEIDKTQEKEQINIYYQLDQYQEGKLTYEVCPEQAGPCYLYIDGRRSCDIHLKVNDEEIPIEYNKGNYIIYLGEHEVGEKIKLEVSLFGEEFAVKDLRFYTLNAKTLLEASEQLKEQAFMIETYTETSFDGSITVSKEYPYFFTSIPFDKGWSLYVDDKLVPTEKVMNGFLGARLEEGKHKLHLVYSPYGLKAGKIISSISWLILVGLVFVHFKQKKKEKIDIMSN